MTLSFPIFLRTEQKPVTEILSDFVVHVYIMLVLDYDFQFALGLSTGTGICSL